MGHTASHRRRASGGPGATESWLVARCARCPVP